MTKQRRRRGAPLWRYLTALVMLPLIGVVVLATAAAQARAAEASSAERAEDAMRTFAVLDAARRGAEQELIPVLSLRLLADPQTLAVLNLPPELVQSQAQTAAGDAARARAVTDQALADVPYGSVGWAAAERSAADLAVLRSGTDTGDIEDVYLRFLAVSNDLMTAQQAAAATATAEGIPRATLRALQDVQTIARLTQAASRQLPLFLGAMFAGDDSMIGSRTAWQTAGLDFTDAERQMESLSQPALRSAWRDVQDSEPATTVDRLLAGVDSGTPVSVASVVTLILATQERSALLGELVDSAIGNAQELVSADRQHANNQLRGILGLGAGLLAASLVGALVLGRRVARALRLLAGQATQISQGSLVEVEVDGPREVRTVSAALGSAVAGLRRIQDQAQAVARGDLDNALLDQPLPGPLGEVVHASVREIVHSVRQREELQFALAHQATHDALTELPNRAQAVTLVTAALHRGRRSGEMTGLLFVDLDGFKAVNDGHGHAAGDEVLREVARRLRAAVRPGDVVCRLGGDEFVVLVEPVHTEHDLLELAHRLIASVSEPIGVGRGRVRIGASIGVAISRDGSTDADALFAEADTAAYRAKASGRGRAEVFDETLRRQLQQRAELEAAIAAGLVNGEMQVAYQPVIDVASDRIIGYEALIRWERPGIGLVPPDEFIPVAEGSRLIGDVDRWMLHAATQQLAQWRAESPAGPGDPDPTIAVNISGRHLADPRVITDVADALAASGLPARLLTLEVTETVLVDDPLAYDHLTELRALGVSIAIDDFGTGYTSIGQLRNMPVDTLKIDRSFVASTEPAHRELVALMIRAAHTFGLTVVAEGVEEPAQLARLKAQDCDQAQGFLLYRPMGAPEAGALLRRTEAAGSV
ncbi:diguanylate cyclase (GGDEF) domain-containing protein [Blastococcus aggregatus]|uniref:Diguanylate cyclase (GGDEF) domain-containing protein n=1 Tax=Blastococcus aggregatus TaxID=38502 RepID=A0A285V596_9ACTN|nr:EAL domain-containing protein [Blastococcus aggregatus]SOC49304.1 diguanylate cyclase (GGDEF) domain-containing protein [Blastococcus aggregatus]